MEMKEVIEIGLYILGIAATFGAMKVEVSRLKEDYRELQDQAADDKKDSVSDRRDLVRKFESEIARVEAAASKMNSELMELQRQFEVRIFNMLDKLNNSHHDVARNIAVLSERVEHMNNNVKATQQLRQELVRINSEKDRQKPHDV